MEPFMFEHQNMVTVEEKRKHTVANIDTRTPHSPDTSRTAGGGGGGCWQKRSGGVWKLKCQIYDRSFVLQ